MRPDHQHHGRSAVVVEPTQKTTKRRAVGDEDKRLVGLRRGRNKGECQRHAARHLYDECNQGGGSENVPPFCILWGNMLHRLK